MEEAREIVTTTLAALPSLCTSTLLPQHGILTLANGGRTVTLAQAALYEAPCHTILPRTNTPIMATSLGDSSLTSHDDPDSPQISDFRDPFYASTFPICYALAATTVTAYMLVIMLFITPRSFLDGGVVRLSRRSFTNSSSGSVSIGGRPWLQKVAALTVAISLTVATADTFQIAGEQYSWGAQNAKVLQSTVMGGTELKAIRLVSDTFLWLAQAQTLIRLFPRQREKVIIKWVAFALITLDLIFSALNSFLYSDNGVTGNGHPGSFAHPIPTLSYLFQLSLGLLYAAWVIYYSLMKKRYAFYHPLMKNICLVAGISLISIVIPVVFFILDISQPDFTGWGDYVRWVGAAAASVVVWEWVERIESLEREEKKDGILGREVFNDDDMLQVNASDFPSLRNRRNRKTSPDGSSNSGGDGQQGSPERNGWPDVSAITSRYRGQNHGAAGDNEQTQRSMGGILRPPIWPTRPIPAVTTPVSRTDTASAASTVYAVRYQAGSEGTSRTPEPLTQQSMLDLARQNSTPRSHRGSEDAASSHAPASVQNGQTVVPAPRRSVDLEANRTLPSQGSRRTWSQSGNNTQHSSSEEASVDGPGQTRDQAPVSSRASNETSRWDLRARMELFAANQADKIRERLRPTMDTGSLPVTIIPAPARRGAALQQVLEEEEVSNGGASPSADALEGGHGGSSRDTSGEMVQLGRSRSGRSITSRGQEPLRPNNPPLWPGVQPRVAYDDDEYSYDDDFMTEETTSSAGGSRRESEDSPRPPRGL